MKCPQCGKEGLLHHKGDRLFQCKTGRLETDRTPGISFTVYVPDYEWDECPHCRAQFHPEASVRRMEEFRRRAVDGIPRFQG